MSSKLWIKAFSKTMTKERGEEIFSLKTNKVQIQICLKIHQTGSFPLIRQKLSKCLFSENFAAFQMKKNLLVSAKFVSLCCFLWLSFYSMLFNISKSFPFHYRFALKCLLGYLLTKFCCSAKGKALWAFFILKMKRN